MKPYLINFFNKPCIISGPGHSRLKLCPFCGEEPKLIKVGDQKEYLVYICSKCFETPVKNGEARYTIQGAQKIWNKRCSFLK